MGVPRVEGLSRDVVEGEWKEEDIVATGLTQWIYEKSFMESCYILMILKYNNDNKKCLNALTLYG